MITLENLKNKNCSCNPSMSGIKAVYLVPLAHIEAFNIRSLATCGYDRVTVETTGGKAITLKAGCSFINVYSDKNLGELKYTPAGGVNKYFQASLEIFHPGFKRKLLGFLGSMINQDLVMIVKMSNGQYHLLGNENRGVLIDDGTEATSGKATADNNGATVMFRFDTPAPMIFVDEWQPTDEETGIELFRYIYLLTTEDDETITTEDNNLIEL